MRFRRSPHTSSTSAPAARTLGAQTCCAHATAGAVRSARGRRASWMARRMEESVPLPEGPVVGTCGFGYQEWRGRFYPPELTAGEWLGFYARVFEAVELDGTFSRPPERSVVAAWAASLPEKFALSAKVPRAITHEARLEGEAAMAMLRVFAGALEPLGDRLLAVVLQLPPSLGAGEGRERLARLLGTRPDGLPVVVEFRHRSWDRPWLGRPAVERRRRAPRCGVRQQPLRGRRLRDRRRAPPPAAPAGPRPQEPVARAAPAGLRPLRGSEASPRTAKCVVPAGRRLRGWCILTPLIRG